MAKAKGRTDQTLLAAVLVAVIAVCVFLLGLQGPAENSSENAKPTRLQLQQRHQRALASLKQSGVPGIIEAVDFGDGLGLGVTQHVDAGTVLLTVPESMALATGQLRICGRQQGTDTPHQGDNPECQVERDIEAAIAQQHTSEISGLLALLVLERRRSSTSSPDVDPIADVVATLPNLAWQRKNGLFALDEAELRIVGQGTSLEGWREKANDATRATLKFIKDKLPHLKDVSLEEVRWAYLMLQRCAQWLDDAGTGEPAGIDLPLDSVLFLWPLFLARPTPEPQHGVQIHHNKEARVYEVVASQSMRSGDEVHFVDRRLSDASVLSFQGQWLTAHHRMRLQVNVTGASKDAASVPTLKKYGCSKQPLQFYVTERKGVDNHFMSCMRMLVLAKDGVKLQQQIKTGWADHWPATNTLEQKSEAKALELGVGALQPALDRLGSASAELRRKFGGDAAAKRPTIQVREAETMIVVSMMKSLKQMQLSFESSRMSGRGS